ncbi:DUF2231 domain-containing protein [Azospirillum picis]|uniref:Membrane protein n=1 Tax=Azospirillum picis TaxID=488438 RepID=A0ABU0MM47_9PROT|nr:DUF2231 domain-containing protein [Azospirillum picis]MBP2301066.1 putative membrane protein [Azospirillum picis]MDQ0534314.1 putative membrane protein [Azospirillum picis]
MAVTFDQRPVRRRHPLHAVLLAGTIPLFLGGLLSDFAYFSSYEVQWNNFAAWLIAGAMVFTGLALLWSLVDLVRGSPDRKRALVYFLLLLVTFALGLANSFVHARDAWGTMPDGLVLSAVVALTAVLATWVGFSSFRAEE